MSKRKPATTPSVQQMATEQHALELRRAGFEYQQIADQLHLGSKATAWKIVRRALARTIAEPAADVRELESQRLDRLQAGIWSKAIRGDLPAIDKVLKIQDRRAKLLGLDHSASLANRLVALEEQKVMIVAIAFGKALDGLELTEEQRTQVTNTFMLELAPAEEETENLEDDQLEEDVVDAVIVEDPEPEEPA